jgi:hypothetical protein
MTIEIALAARCPRDARFAAPPHRFPDPPAA